MRAENEATVWVDYLSVVTDTDGDGVPDTVEEWYEKRLDCTLTEWLDYEREHLPELLETVFEEGEWLWTGET